MAGTAIEVSRESVKELFVAVAQQAEHSAMLVARLLRRRGLRGPISLPRGFLLQLAAAIRIREWEMSGVASVPLGELPSSDDVLASAFDSLLRLCDGTAEDDPQPAILRQVLGVWFRHFALTARADLGTEVIVRGAPPRESLDQIADYLWRFRHLGKEEH